MSFMMLGCACLFTKASLVKMGSDYLFCRDI